MLKSARHTLFCLLALYSLIVGCGQSTLTEISSTETQGIEMANLTIDLQDGFVDDTVVLVLNDKQILQMEHVSTKLLLGYADSVTAQVEKGQVDLKISVPTRDETETIRVDVSDPTYIGISIEAGKIKYITSHQPFGYQ